MSRATIAGRHLVVACGGTGGHVYPALAIAQAFAAQNGQVTFLLAGQNLAEHTQAVQAAGFPALAAACFRRPQTAAQTAALPLTASWAVLRSLGHLHRLRPDAILAMGSFAGVAPALAGALMGIPLFLHEGNTIVGKANRFLSRHARHLALSLPLASSQQRPRCPTSVTGFPLRPDLTAAAVAPPAVSTCRATLSLIPDRQTLLVFGGSQGAQTLNQAVRDALPMLAKVMPRLQVLHLTGIADNQDLAQAYAANGIHAIVKQREQAMHLAYTAADLVVCRAGAGTLSELALFAKPAILVPLPSAADNHQHYNARCAEATGGAVLVAETALQAPLLAARLHDWLADPAALRQRGQQLHQLACPDAAAAVVQLLSTKLG